MDNMMEDGWTETWERVEIKSEKEGQSESWQSLKEWKKTQRWRWRDRQSSCDGSWIVPLNIFIIANVIIDRSACQLNAYCCYCIKHTTTSCSHQYFIALHYKACRCIITQDKLFTISAFNHCNIKQGVTKSYHLLHNEDWLLYQDT